MIDSVKKYVLVITKKVDRQLSNSATFTKDLYVCARAHTHLKHKLNCNPIDDNVYGCMYTELKIVFLFQFCIKKKHLCIIITKLIFVIHRYHRYFCQIIMLYLFVLKLIGNLFLYDYFKSLQG